MTKKRNPSLKESDHVDITLQTEENHAEENELKETELRMRKIYEEGNLNLCRRKNRIQCESESNDESDPKLLIERIGNDSLPALESNEDRSAMQKIIKAKKKKKKKKRKKRCSAPENIDLDEKLLDESLDLMNVRNLESASPILENRVEVSASEKKRPSESENNGLGEVGDLPIKEKHKEESVVEKETKRNEKRRNFPVSDDPDETVSEGALETSDNHQELNVECRKKKRHDFLESNLDQSTLEEAIEELLIEVKPETSLQRTEKKKSKRRRKKKKKVLTNVSIIDLSEELVHEDGNELAKAQKVVSEVQVPMKENLVEIPTGSKNKNGSPSLETKDVVHGGNEEYKPLQWFLTLSETPRNRRKLLVLDLNGLLADIASAVPRGFKADKRIGKKPVFKRLFCEDFLKFCFERFNVGVWSSRAKKNVNSMIDFLMGSMKQNLLFSWDQSYCTLTGFKTIENKHKPLVLKELRKLWDKNVPGLPWEKGEYNELNTLLLDDSPYKALRNPPHTAVFPYPYNFQDKNDNSLGPGGDIRVYLEGLAMAEDVQKYVELHRFGQPAITDKSPLWGFYSRVIGSLM